MSVLSLLWANLRCRWAEWWQPQGPDLIRRYQRVWQADVVRTREGRS